MPLVEVRTGKDHYPFSGYRMYRLWYNLDRLEDAKYQLYALYEDGEKWIERGRVAGIGETAIRAQALNLFIQNPLEQAKVLIHDSLADVLKTCLGPDKENQTDNCEGLKGLRLYEVRYASVDELRDKRPTSRTLMVEALAPNE